jgi:2,4-dienoyl-CoA reductase-like NADH-dependent reductase (Old Yellow Enzyme family)
MKLFEPITIKHMEMKNRLIMPAMQLGLGLRSRRAQNYYLERAKGGVGAIIMAATSVDLLTDDQAWGRPDGVIQFIGSARSFTEAVRNSGARIGIQLWHGNQLPAGSGAGVLPGAEMVAPSAKNNLRQLTVEEIKSIIEKFGAASGKAREAGFDFIELHGAHGYLLCQFFSGADNNRTDHYGGDVSGRMNFGLETVKAAREAVGDDFPVFFRIGAEEGIPEGVTLDQSKLFAVELEKAGVDVLDVSLGRNEGQSASPDKNAEMGTFAYLAGAIKQEVNIPVIAVGRINTREVAESILTQGQADLIAVGRQLIADPHWPNKIKENQIDEVVACESCNTCFGPLLSSKWRPGDRICKVNERAGKEIDDEI